MLKKKKNLGIYGSTIFLERTRKDHGQSDEPWTCFKCNIGKRMRDGYGTHNGFSESI